jgi:hypothetical protein
MQEIEQYLMGVIQALGSLTVPTTEQNTAVLYSVYQTLHHVQNLLNEQTESAKKADEEA